MLRANRIRGAARARSILRNNIERIERTGAPRMAARRGVVGGRDDGAQAPKSAENQGVADEAIHSHRGRLSGDWRSQY